jgi:hypothetical protein
MTSVHNRPRRRTASPRVDVGYVRQEKELPAWGQTIISHYLLPRSAGPDSCFSMSHAQRVRPTSATQANEEGRG